MADPSSNLEAERAVLARVLAWPVEYGARSAELRPQDFIHGPHAAIWRGLGSLAVEGEAPSIPLLRSRLDEAGAQAVDELLREGCGVSVAAEVRELQACALRRRQLSLAA